MAELYGKPRSATSEAEGYESPDEYSDQGDTRIVRDLLFSYMAETTDAAGNPVLTPVEVPRDAEISLDEMGLLAQKQGEDNHSFYTSEERERLESGQNPESGGATTSAGGVSEMGEYELAEYIKGDNPEGRALKAQEVVDLAAGDKDLAHRLLQAENIASDGDPRKSVEHGLTTIIEDSTQ
jgi:hypothetical protein